MCSNMRKMLIVLIVIFVISLFLVILINFYEIKVLREIDQNLQIIYIALALKAFIIVIMFHISLILIFYLFNKEINFDHMTGLCSRRKMYNDLNGLVKKNKSFTICYIDLNGFKKINDLYGHEAGDTILQTFSKRVIQLKNRGIMGYRVGGDEFVIIITNLIQIDSCIENIWQIAGCDVKISKHESTKITFAMGILDNDFISTPEELIKRADSNMYNNKRMSKKMENNM